MPQATNIIKNPVKRDGTSQKQRQLPALDPSFVKIDERTLEDFLVFAQEYSKRILFYNTDNEQDGTWESFWGSDPTLIIAAIEKTNPLPAKTACEEILSSEPSVEGFHALVMLSLEISRKIEYWYNNLLTGSNLNVEIKRYIQANFQGFLEQLATYEKGASTLFEDYPGIDDDNYKGFSNEWEFNVNDLDGIEFDPSLFRPEIPINEENPAKCFENFTTEEHLNAAYPGLKDLFTTAYNVYFQIVQVAPEHFKESLTRKDHPAHLALFISFLMLYSQVQDDLNRMTQRHLDFYYKDILGLQTKEAVPDKVHLFFELAKNRLEHSLDGGVRFKAGKDTLGNDMYFSLDKSTVVNIATVESLRTIFLPTSLTGNLKKVTGIHAAPVANSADGMGEEIKDEEKPSWATVGNDKMPVANLGFVIASNELALAEGIRKVTLDIHTKGNVVLSGKPFNILLSGEKDWISADYTLNDSDPSNPSLPGKGFRLQFTLQPESPAVVPFDAETFEEDLGTDLPLMKILLQNSLQNGVLNYEKLRNLKIEKIVLSVDVSDVQQIKAFNDEGTIITDKPFMPFTTNPKKGSSFYVGNAEAFQKSLEEVKLNLTWEQVPNNFNDYYKGYNLPGSNNASKGSLEPKDFKAKISLQRNGITSEISAQSPKFIFGNISNDANDVEGLTDLVNTIVVNSPGKLLYAYPADEILNYGISSKDGFLRLDLQQDFEHDQYSNVFSRQILAVSKFPVRIIGAWYDTGTGIKKADADDPAEVSSWEVIIPKTPYTPSLKSITLSYTSSASTRVSADAGVITFIHLHPFADTYQNFDEVNGVPLVPQFGGRVKQLPSLSLVSNALSIIAPNDSQVILLEEAALLIGLNGLKPRQSLSILFQLAENTANAEIPKSQVYWYYLSDNEWLPFEEYQVVSDTTDGLLTSGIIEFAIPDGINTQNTILPNNMHWLKAAVMEYPGSISESINIHTQAAGATFEDNENDLSHLLEPLPAETISKLENDDVAVKGINQPYDSFGGLPAEDSLNFYTRVSERLRHKGRAITQYDYERLVLEAYPSIYKVKCINHTDCDHNLSPGHVLVSVVPDFSKLKAVDRRQPKVSLAQLEKIKRFLDDRNTCFVSDSVTTLHVLNPVYEMIDLDFSVRFTPDITAVDFYLRKLKEDIVTFLSPWSIDDAAEINFGGKVFKSSILHFVEKQSYVDFVMNFKMMHDGSTEDTNIIEAGTPRSILVPVLEENMNIQHISTEDYCKMDNRITKQALGYQSLDETILGD